MEKKDAKKVRKKKKNVKKKAAAKKEPLLTPALKREIGALFVWAFALLSGIAVYAHTAGAALKFIERQYLLLFGVGAYLVPPFLVMLGAQIMRPHRILRFLLVQYGLAALFAMTSWHLVRLPQGAACLSGGYASSAGGWLGGLGGCGLYAALGKIGGSVLLGLALLIYLAAVTPISYYKMFEIALDALKIVFNLLGAVGKPVMAALQGMSDRMAETRANAVAAAVKAREDAEVKALRKREEAALASLADEEIESGQTDGEEEAAIRKETRAERKERLREERQLKAEMKRREKEAALAALAEARLQAAAAEDPETPEPLDVTAIPQISAWEEEQREQSGQSDWPPKAAADMEPFKAEEGEASSSQPGYEGRENIGSQPSSADYSYGERIEVHTHDVQADANEFDGAEEDPEIESAANYGDIENPEDDELKKKGLELEVGFHEMGETAEALDEEEAEWALPMICEWLDPTPPGANEGPDMTLKTRLEQTLQNFSVPARVVNLVRGAAFTRCELALEPGVKVNRISGLENDIAYALARSPIRIEAPIPGKSLVGVEVPNNEVAVVPLRKIYESDSFQNSRDILSFVVGEDIAGVPVWASLSKMPHMLVAGATGSGKSVCLNSILCSLIGRRTPEDVRCILIDMKRVELTPYNGLPHLIAPVVKEPTQAANALKWALGEMEARYKKFADVHVRNIDTYNSQLEDPSQRLYRIVIVIDELADLMMTAGANLNVELIICRIAQMARATGIHLILATQRPDTKVITGTIKVNIPSRIAFAVTSQIDSRTILDTGGAESLLGRGDMLFQPSDSNKLLRLQGAFVSDKEIQRLVDFWKTQGTPEFVTEFAEEAGKGGTFSEDDKFTTEDEALYKKALEVVVATNQASISAIQRRLRIGYNRAARLVEMMEERGVIGPYDGSKPREILVTAAMLESSRE